MSIASTTWKPVSGNGEYSDITPVNIIDPSGNFLVDPITSDNVISTDLEFTQVSKTIWMENEAA